MQKAFIFDMDGTMIDNMMLHHRCWQKTLSVYGLDMTLEEVKATCHGKNTEIIARLFPGKYTMEECNRISFEKEQMYRDIFLPDLKLVDGLMEFLERSKSEGVVMGIGTAAPKGNVDFVLDNLNIRHFFSAIVDADDVDKGKPDPTVFFRVAEKMGIAPEECLVFEDSPTGARTALNAGMKAIIITTTHSEEDFAGIASVEKFISDFFTI